MATQVLAPNLQPRVLAAAVRRRPESSLHQRLEGALRELITSGRIEPGTVIAGELELADKLHLSRHTVRHALGVLANEGLLRRERGRGTTVVAGTPTVIERSLASFYAFAWEARAAGAEQRSRVLERSEFPADEVVAERLRVRRGARVERIVRVRTLNDEPLVLETAYLPQALSSALDSHVLEHGSIYDALELVHGLTVARAHETIRPTILRRATARLLGCPIRLGSVFRRADHVVRHAPDRMADQPCPRRPVPVLGRTSTAHLACGIARVALDSSPGQRRCSWAASSDSRRASSCSRSASCCCAPSSRLRRRYSSMCR